MENCYKRRPHSQSEQLERVFLDLHGHAKIAVLPSATLCDTSFRVPEPATRVCPVRLLPPRIRSLAGPRLAGVVRPTRARVSTRPASEGLHMLLWAEAVKRSVRAPSAAWRQATTEGVRRSRGSAGGHS